MCLNQPRYPFLTSSGADIQLCTSFLQKDASGEKMKDLAIEMNITPSAVAYLKKKVPLKS